MAGRVMDQERIWLASFVDEFPWILGEYFVNSKVTVFEDSNSKFWETVATRLNCKAVYWKKIRLDSQKWTESA